MLARRPLAALLVGLAASCSPAAEPPPAVPVAPPLADPLDAADAPLAPLPPLDEREQVVMAELERDVRKLSGEMGQRHPGERWNLAAASDYLAGELEAAGYALVRTGYEADGNVVQILEAVVPGGLAKGRHAIVVGAHYDTVPESPGADDNASGVAAVLALARAFHGKDLGHTLKFVLFPLGEAPYAGTPSMGSARYAEAASREGDDIAIMLAIENIGYYSDAPDSQRYPPDVADRFSRRGDFVAIVGNPDSEGHVDRVLSAFRKHASIPAEGAALSEDTPGAAASDHAAFWKVGYPAVMITDTADFRYPHHHASTDTADKLSFDRMARVVVGLERALTELAGKPVRASAEASPTTAPP